MPRNTSRSNQTVDFNTLWPSKDLTKLADAVGKNIKGICGCEPHCHGSKSLVYGYTFRDHMTRIYTARHSSLPAQSSRSSLPLAPSTSRLQSLPPDQSNTYGSLDNWTAGDDTYDSGNEGDEEQDLEDSAMRLEQAEPRQLGVIAEEEAEEPEEVLVETLNDFIAQFGAGEDIGEPRDNSPTPPPGDLADVSLKDVTFGHQLQGLVDPDDLILHWPFPIPTYLLEPPHAGNKPNPYADASPFDDDLPFAERLAPLLNHALVGTFNVSRRASELVLKVFGTAVRLAERAQYQKDRRWYEARHRVNGPTEQELDELNPALGDESNPVTARSALNKLAVNDHVYEHPMCKNSDCHHVFYDIIDRSGLANLPEHCPGCACPCFCVGKPDVLYFGRRTLWCELETVLNVPGVEEAVERRMERKDKRDEEDQAMRDALGTSSYSKVLREQDDGDAWTDERDDNIPTHLEGCLSLTVNLGLDWASPSSRRSAAANSMGPISLHLADLPCQARSSVACSMVMGITPGPKEPKGQNLWKLLLPLILELRSAQLNGLWVKTPNHPQGRLVRVKLGCIIADRPAACMITGGSHYSSPETACLRCTVHKDDLAQVTSTSPAPARIWRQHALTQLEQESSYHREVEAERATWEAEEDGRDQRARRPRKRRPFPESRREAVRDRVWKLRGHVSVLALIPGFDGFAATPFDAMHAILEGICRAYFFDVMVRGDLGLAGDEEGGAGSQSDASEGTRGELAAQARQLLKEVREGTVMPRTEAELRSLDMLAAGIGGGRDGNQKRVLGPADLSALQALIADVQVPSSIVRLHPLFGTPSAGTPTADQWRAFGSVYAPLVLPRLWKERATTVKAKARFNPEELQAMLMISEIIILALRSSISDTQINALESHIDRWSTLVFRLHPSIKRKTNFHVVRHTVQDIRSHGPPYNWWSFLVERINYHAKNVNHAASSSAPQIATYKALLRARQVESTRMRVLENFEPSSFEEEEAKEELEKAFQANSVDKASSSLEILSARYHEVEAAVLQGLSNHRAGRSPIRFTHGSQQFNLDRVLLNSLQACLSRAGVETRINARPTAGTEHLVYLDDTVQLYQTMEWGRTRIDAAEFGHRIEYAPSVERIRQLVRSRNSLIEVVKPVQRYGLQGGVPISGLLCLLYEHAVIGTDGQKGETCLYAVLRKFEQHTEDPYGIGNHPLCASRVWVVDRLAPPVTVKLGSAALDCLRLLAITRQPHGDGEVWATIPVDRH